jgi:hypothetical protein
MSNDNVTASLSAPLPREQQSGSPTPVCASELGLILPSRQRIALEAVERIERQIPPLWQVQGPGSAA